MKRFLIGMCMSAIVIGAMGTASCSGGGQGKASATSEKKAGSGDGKAEGVKVAYVCIDSILNQYKFCTDHSKILEKRMNNIQATLNSKGAALQNKAIDFQKKLQGGQYTSQEQAMAAQQSLQKQQASLEKLQAKYSAQFEKERQKYNDEMRDSIQSFLKDYNKDKKYDLILSKIENNILLADESMNITEDVVNGLNKRYKSSNSGKAAKK